jgi:F-type H+-transporting ATPase subunit delta
MAGKSIIAKRYSRGFLESCQNIGQAQKGLESLEIISQAMSGSEELKDLLSSPGFTAEEKWGVIDELLKRAGGDAELVKFAKILVETKRIDLVPEITEQLKSEVLKKLGEEEAIIETAYALDAEELAKVIKGLEASTGKKLRAVVRVRPELVAGLRVQIGGRTLDASLAASLDKMKKQLIQAEA